jgi:hypothetical protein
MKFFFFLLFFFFILIGVSLSKRCGTSPRLYCSAPPILRKLSEFTITHPLFKYYLFYTYLITYQVLIDLNSVLFEFNYHKLDTMVGNPILFSKSTYKFNPIKIENLRSNYTTYARHTLISIRI